VSVSSLGRGLLLAAALLLGCTGPGDIGAGVGQETGDADSGAAIDTGPGTDTAGPVDADGDGVPVDEGDCDDAEPAVYPGAPERWGDGVDQDCDGADLSHADACADAAPCPDATEIYASVEAWAGIEQCSSIPGTLSWTPQSGGGSIANTCVTAVGGDVVIEGNTAVSDLRPLQRIASIGGDLKLISLPALEDLAGLEALRQTGEHVLVLRNERLRDLDPLTGLETVGRKLSLEDNAVLEDVDALLNLGLVGETLRISGNPALCEAAVTALVSHAQSTNPDVEVVLGDNGGC
jgi:hypothetical protein